MKNLLVFALVALTLSTHADDGDRRYRNRNNDSTSRDGSVDTRGGRRGDDRDTRDNRGNYNSGNYNNNSSHRRHDRDNRYDSNTNRRDDRYNSPPSRDGSYDTRGRDRYDDSRNPNYRVYRHVPDRSYTSHRTRYYNPRDYQRSYSNYIYLNRWLRISIGYSNGYYYYSDYPYFVYNGYSHRYSSYDNCNYELVDSYSNSVERTFYSYTCSMGYDMCADLRDDLNEYQWDNRYFCAERYEY